MCCNAGLDSSWWQDDLNVITLHQDMQAVHRRLAAMQLEPSSTDIKR